MRKCILLLWIPLFATIDTQIEVASQEFMQQSETKALAVAVIYNNPALPNPVVKRTYSFGTISKQSRVPVNQHTEFRIGPITQTMTGALLASMVKDGRGELLSPAGKYLPRSSTLPSFRGKSITLADLAASTSALPDVPYDLDKRTAVSSSELFRILSNYELKRAPGEERSPSNIGYALLANLISRMGRADYTVLLKNKILQPLRMSDTQFTLTPEKTRRRATGYEEGRAIPPHIYERLYSVFLGAAGLFSTIDDMSMWLSFNLGVFTGHLAPLLPIMHKPIFEESGGRSYALGWEITSLNGRRVYSQGGALFGFSSYIVFIPERHMGVVLLSNNGDISLEALGKKVLYLLAQ